MKQEQFQLWAKLSVQIAVSRHHDGLSLEQLANAIADSLDIPETRRLIHFLEAEIDKKMEADVTIQ